MATTLLAASCTSSSPGEEEASAAPGSLSITGVSVVLQDDGQPYITMAVESSSDDSITGVEVDPELVAASVVMTESNDLDSESGSGPLEPGAPVDVVPVAGGEVTEIGPGSFGMWLVEPLELAEGSLVDLTLTFENAGSLDVQAPVR